MKKISCSLLALLSLSIFSAHADVVTATQAANDYGLFAKKLNPNVVLSAQAGRAFYVKKIDVKGKDLSCAACHTDNPANTGKHNESGKPIKPMAPAVNPQRFSDIGKSAVGFSKHCRDLYGKDCAPADKANFISYLVTVK